MNWQQNPEQDQKIRNQKYNEEYEMIQRESNIQSTRAYDRGFREGVLEGERGRKEKLNLITTDNKDESKNDSNLTQMGVDDGYKMGFLSGFLSLFPKEEIIENHTLSILEKEMEMERRGQEIKIKNQKM